ncbi:anaerobic C4-dicarboxylate transporter family protein [Cardinium endosymbiont of Tipula unca]|uniref:anaerobic C4-dicarboxylate transporter family protein n=1 Tax=Cardinium endosymbiont of Tipula unca TaxID=3066216 RepID=UPI0030CCDAB0
MAMTGWIALVLVLVIGLRLDGIAIGLLSGLGLSLLTFLGYVQPVSPPSELIILQASWLIFNATLDAIGFFYFLNEQLRIFLQKHSRYPYLCALIFCYCLTFVTGDRRCFNMHDPSIQGKLSIRQLVSVRIAMHMASLASPLSISGILLLLVLRNNFLPALGILCMVLSGTVVITVLSSMLLCLIPCTWSTKLDQSLKLYYNSEVTMTDIGADSKWVKYKSYILVFSFLCLVQVVFLLSKPQSGELTRVICCEKVFLVKLPMFLTLVLLSAAALFMLYAGIKPAKIVQSKRFRLGIQQFFIYFGLAWLAETLITNDKAFLGKMFNEISIFDHPFFYLICFFCLLLVDAPIVIWLFVPVLIWSHFSLLNLTLIITFLYFLSLVRSFLVEVCRSKM